LSQNELSLISNKSAELRAYLDAKQVTVDSYKTTVLNAEKVRFPFSLIIFGLPFGFAVMSLVGYFGMSSCFKHQGVLAWTMLVCMWPLMGFHLSLAMTFGDSCIYMDQMETEIASGTSAPDPIEAAALQACLTDSSIIDALNLTIPFTPPVFNIPSTTFSTPRLNAAITALDSLTLVDLGITAQMQADYDSNLTQTGLTPPATEQQLQTASSSPNATVAQAASLCLTFMMANDTATATLDSLQTRAAQLVADMAAVTPPLDTCQTALVSLDAILQPLVDACDTIKSLGYCGSIGDSYKVFKDTWCNVITTAFSFLALSCMILGIFSGAFVYLSIMLTKRFGLKRLGRADGKYNADAQMVAVERGNRRSRREARRRRRDSYDAAG